MRSDLGFYSWYSRHRFGFWASVYLLIFAGPEAWHGIALLAEYYPDTLWLKAVDLLSH